jgi:translation elongation factor P/translation initiation factor 5A
MACVRRARKSVESDTQRLRAKLLKKLEAIFNLAEDSVKTAATPRQKQAYMRIMGYIAQVMNSLSKTFDEAMVTKDLEALEKMISEAMAKGKDKGAEGEARAASGS